MAHPETIMVKGVVVNKGGEDEWRGKHLDHSAPGAAPAAAKLSPKQQLIADIQAIDPDFKPGSLTVPKLTAALAKLEE